MLDPGTIQRAELYFRTYLHTVMPLHRSLVEEMCGSSELPLELATALEDIGQRYMDLADDLNRELIRRGQLNHEPEPEDSGEARIEEFLDSLMARAGTIQFSSGQRLDGALALGASEPARDAIRTALILARSVQGCTFEPEGHLKGGPRGTAELG